MARYIVTERAQRDMDEIWDYSVHGWGTAQAEKYLREIQSTIATLASNPRTGRSAGHIRKGYRMFPAATHMIFYRLAGEDIEIIRILHQSQDFGRHLRSLN